MKFKQWWQPSKFVVRYCKEFGMANNYDKFEYDNLEEAKTRQKYLRKSLSEQGYYIQIEQITSGNPIKRLLNRFGSKRMYKIFGCWI
jgi:hypothetical protein